MRLLRVAVLSALLAIPTSALASPFCDGFKAGWKSALEAKGKVSAPPSCPPGNMKDYQGGFSAGVEAALRKIMVEQQRARGF